MNESKWHEMMMMIVIRVRKVAMMMVLQMITESNDYALTENL